MSEAKRTLAGKNVGILVEDDFEDVELTEPLKDMKEAGANVVIIGSGSKRTYRGKGGTLTVDVDMSADGARADDFDAIIIPGGYAPDKMRLSPAMVQLVKNAAQSGKLIAAVCHGPQLLISADLVHGRRMTSWPSVAIDLKNAGAQYVEEPVVRDGNLITARKPEDLPQFSKAIIEALS